MQYLTLKVMRSISYNIICQVTVMAYKYMTS